MKVLSTLNRFILSLSGILLGIMTFLVIIQVFFRYVLEKPLTGSEELARFTMIWLVMIGSTVVLRNKSHIAVEFFVELFPTVIQKGARIITYLLIFVFAIILMVDGYQLAMTSMSQISPATRIPNGYIAMSIPVSGFISALYMLESLFQEFFSKNRSTDMEKGVEA
ncbi:TRAP transporter small permease [Neobacillus mesonae]|uniref:TRAP transporter small permease n=1 Tax=Neobacillus mesonae TaxID=1193713 RepID=UPI00203B562E|nr:TRAP transporter small permease [Neobacillus mesonae]MCM3568479.1 TRAP transporter small permease [Neobacillus mesonae]